MLLLPYFGFSFGSQLRQCGDVFVCGQSGVSVTEGGIGDTSFLNGQDGHGSHTHKQVSLCLHLTATGGIRDPIPEGCSYAFVRADSSGDSNSVQMGTESLSVVQ